MTDSQAPRTAPPGWYSDPASGRMRWWNGFQWTENFQTGNTPVVPVVTVSNGLATASLVLGICGFVLMGIPLFIGLVVGGIPDILAVILGIVALNSVAARAGIGRASAIVGLVLGAVSLLSAFVGAGTLW